MSSMNFEDAYVPLRVANWLTGLRSIGYSSSRICAFLNVLFVCIILVPCLMIAYYRPDEYLDIRNPFDKTLRVCYIYMHLPFIGLILLTGWRNTKMSRCYFRCLRSADATLETLGAPDVCYKAIYHISIMVLAATTLHTLSQLYFSGEWDNLWAKGSMPFLFLWSFVYSKSVRNIVVLDYVINIRFLGSRFRQANCLLDKVVAVATSGQKPMLRPSKDIFVVPQSRSSRTRCKVNKFWVIRSLQIIKQIHLELTKTGGILNSMFGLQILIETAALLIGTIVLLFTIYEIKGQAFLPFGDRMREVTVIALVCAVQCFKVIVMNYISEDTQREAQKTKEIIHSIEGTSFDDETQLEIRQFSLQLAQCTFECSAFGFVSLNNGFIRGFFGAVTTYSVIIIQMNTLVNTQINNGTETASN